MKSMTGYGSSRAHSKEFDLEVSARAVNGRFLDIRVHLPREYLSLESELKSLAGGYLQRGTVDIYINRKLRPGSSQMDVQLNKPMAQRWQQSYEALAYHLGLNDSVSLEKLAELPEVMKLVESSELSEKEVTTLKKTFSAALRSCQQERVREGKALKEELLAHLTRLEELCRKMQTHRQAANKELRKKLDERLKRSDLADSVDPQRYAQEVAFYIDRSDISEEISRLKEHVKKCRSLVRGRESQGKKLDFYCQELLREVNTIGAKSQVAPLTETVVNAKSVVEKLREQVQNVE